MKELKERFDVVNERITKLQSEYNVEIRDLTNERSELKTSMKNLILNEFEKRFEGHIFGGYLSEIKYTPTCQIYEPNMIINLVDQCQFDRETRKLFRVKQRNNYGGYDYYGAHVVSYVDSTISLDECDEFAAELADKYGLDIKMATFNYNSYAHANDIVQVKQPQPKKELTWRDYFSSRKEELIFDALDKLQTLENKTTALLSKIKTPEQNDLDKWSKY